MTTLAAAAPAVKLASVVIFHPAMVRRMANPAFGHGLVVTRPASLAEALDHYLATTYSAEEKLFAEHHARSLEWARVTLAGGEAAIKEAEFERLREIEHTYADPIDAFEEEGASFADELAAAIPADRPAPIAAPARVEKPFTLRQAPPAEFVRLLPLDSAAAPEAPAIAPVPTAELPATPASEVTIKGLRYAIDPIPADPDFGTAAFRMTKPDGESYYLLASNFGTLDCDCPDYVFTKDGTGRPCKHGAALIAAGHVPAPNPRGFAPIRPTVAGVGRPFDEFDN